MKNLFILLILFYTSCSLNGLGPEDESILTRPTSKPKDSFFIGTWSLDSISRSVIKKKYKSNVKKVELSFNKNNTFVLKNAPDFITDVFGEPVHQSFIDAQGKWKIVKINKHWQIQMDFDAGQLYPISTSTFYSIFERDSTIVIKHFIGDGDSGERFLYLKD